MTSVEEMRIREIARTGKRATKRDAMISLKRKTDLAVNRSDLPSVFPIFLCSFIFPRGEVFLFFLFLLYFFQAAVFDKSLAEWRIHRMMISIKFPYSFRCQRVIANGKRALSFRRWDFLFLFLFFSFFFPWNSDWARFI